MLDKILSQTKVPTKQVYEKMYHLPSCHYWIENLKLKLLIAYN